MEFKKSLIALSIAAISVGISDGMGNILKTLFERPRPCQVLQGINLLVGCTGSFSFPSNHAANAFSFSAGLAYFFRGAGIPLYLLAVIIAFSRIYVGVHYPSDVVFGALLGTLIFFFVLAVYKWSKTNIEKDKYKTIFILTTLLLTTLRFFYINTGPLALSPDEAHYWEWSRRLDLSYYSKGPMIAYLIAFSTWLMGDTGFAIRFFAPVFLALSSILVYKLTKEIFGNENAAAFAGILIHITPLFSAFGVLMTIDSPFIFFWTLALWLFWRAIKNPPIPPLLKGAEGGFTRYSSLVTRYWLLLGITIGLGLLTKYTMAFFYVCAFLFLLFSKEHRFWFKRKEPYIAFLLSLLVFSPVIIWNAQHDWATVRHTAGQAHVAEGLKISFKYFFEFIGSQIGVITPLLFFIVIYGAIKSRVTSYKLQVTSEDKSSSLVTRYSSLFLFWFWSPVLVFFLIESLHAKVQANWAMHGYITAFIASAGYFLNRDTVKKSVKILLSIAFASALVITVISHYPQVLNLPVKMDPTSRLRGWKELGMEVGKIYEEMRSKRDVFIFSDSYQVSSELAFYTPGKPRTFCINLDRRMNQYDIWGGFNELIGRDAIFVTIGKNDFPEKLKNAFDSYERQSLIVQRNSKILREYSIFKCYGFKGMASMTIESY
ncbi:MAG: glycosyltransferase family 39 protein [Nitrospirae bacterium]|nr:glycosyltransferase family 39 protein [Nitrospirota bacterium]